MMRKVMFVLAVAGLLSLTGSAPGQIVLPAPQLQWSEPRESGVQSWTLFGSIDDDTDTAYIGGFGANGGIYQIGTTQNAGTGIIKGSTASSDATSPVVIGNYVYYYGGDPYVPDIPGRTTPIRRVDLADFGNPSASVYADLYLLGSQTGAPYLTTDGTYLFMGHTPDGSTDFNGTNKLDVNGVPLAGDPFSLTPLWDPQVNMGGERGAAQIRYYNNGGDGEIWKASPQISSEYGSVLSKCSAVHDPGDATNIPTESKQLRNYYEKVIDGVSGSWYQTGYTRVQRYGDLVVAVGSQGQSKGHVRAYPINSEGQDGLEPVTAAERDDWDLTSTYPDGILDMALIGDGSSPTGMWLVGNQTIEAVNYSVLTYWSFGAVPPAHNPGDVDDDGFVGGADFTQVLTNWGNSGVSWGDGDVDPYLDGNDFIGGGDYTEVLTYWGTSYGLEPIPEPATMLVLALGASLALLRRSR